MNEQDRQAINDLFNRLAQIEAQATQKDAEADAYIRQRIAQQPAAPYLMAQTIVVQNAALEQAQQRIQELEAGRGRYDDEDDDDRDEYRSRNDDGRGFEAPRRSGSVPAAGQRPMGVPPLSGQPQYQQPQAGGGGFLAGAAQTAMGVAGGMMLGNMLGGMFGGSSTAQAAPAPDQPAATPAAEPQPAAQPEPAPAEAAPEAADAGDEGGGIFGGLFGSLFGGGDSGDGGDSSFE